MFTKTAKKLWVFISSAVASVCLAVGAIATAPANVAKAAIDGSLSEEVTLNKVVAGTDGKTADGFVVQYKEFEMGESGSTWFMTQFTGKNAPNYAVRAMQGYSSWDGHYTAWSSPAQATITSHGMMICNSSMYNQVGVGVYRGTSTMDESTGERGNVQGEFVNEKGNTQGAFGMRYYNAGTTYVQIIGYEMTGDVTVHLFSVNEGELTLVASATQNMSAITNALAGTKAVIYGNAQIIENANADATALSADNNPDSVTFQYATPANSLNGLLKNVSDYYEYKDDIVTALNITEDVSQKVEFTKTETTVLGGSATLKSINADKDGNASNVENVTFDGFNGDTWFVTQFTGRNAPNYAVRSYDFSAWQTSDSSAANYTGGVNSGVVITNSARVNQRTMQIFQSPDTSATGRASISGESGKGPGLEYFTAGQEYIQIVGYTQNATTSTSADVTVYNFKVNDGVATLVFEGKFTGTYCYNAPKGSTAVIYGSIRTYTQATTNSGTDVSVSGESVTFSYGQPATTLDALVKGLASDYAYKDDLATALGIDIGTVETQTYTATFEDMAGNKLATIADVEGVKLPNSTLTDFVGWYNKVDSKLYKAGEIVALTANTTFVEVAAGISLADGAAVRLKNDIVGNGGLRFEVIVSKAAVDLLGANVVLKGAVIPTDLLDGELTLANGTAGFVTLENMVEKDGAYHAYITLTNIKLENFQREFSARAFFTVKYADGTNATVATAYDEEKNSRSIYEVAVKAYNSGKYGENAVLKYYLDNTVNVAISTNGGEVSVVTAHGFDGLAESFVRGYTVSNVTYADGEVTFTVTLGGLTLTEEFAVTVWTGVDTFETQIVAFENGVATVNFTVAQ